MISIIVAVAENGIIGRDNALIWHLSADLKRFKMLTTNHTVIMGRKTYESIGKPLPNRRNIVISRNFNAIGVEVATSIEEAFNMIKTDEEAFIIGGGSIYKSTIDKVDKLFLTIVHTSPLGDTSFPFIDNNHWTETCREEHHADEKNEFDYTFVDYTRR